MQNITGLLKLKLTARAIEQQWGACYFLNFIALKSLNRLKPVILINSGYGENDLSLSPVIAQGKAIGLNPGGS
ncbi:MULTISPECIES: hypothetical protein [Enterobacteriaceae]|uniref:hypothetical protein n=1 Tax=Enterobacteriaceae TaxID=543 RepID=UPI000FECC9B8|nr:MULTISPECIES: hypothetical protein [Enterobacteriaceae]MDM2835772.1 hypothetical protein [Citrobacter sp. Cpo091]QAR45041.1 hypothetical protein EQG67_04335 [Kosakonia cowanii]